MEGLFIGYNTSAGYNLLCLTAVATRECVQLSGFQLPGNEVK